MRYRNSIKYIIPVLLLALLIIGINQAGASNMLSGGDDLSLTIGKGERGTVTFEFKVINTSSGLVKGDFFATNPGYFTIEGNVDCAWANGNIAVFGGSDQNENPFTVMVSDNPDGIILGNRANCDTTGFGLPIPITSGQIIVTDPK